MSTVSAELFHETYATPFGDGLLQWRGEVLNAHFLPGRWQEPPPSTGMATGGHDRFGLGPMLSDYFSGRPVVFPDGLRLVWSSSSPFTRSVAAALARIPYGETISYSRLAAAAGYPRAQRAVGVFLSRNPFPIILPCHRVIRADGAIGGFSAGKEWKLRLLEIEGFSAE